MLTIQDIQGLADKDNSGMWQMRYVDQSVVDAGISLANVLMAEGFEARDGMCIFPNNLQWSDPIVEGFSTRQASMIERVAAHVMSTP